MQNRLNTLILICAGDMLFVVALLESIDHISIFMIGFTVIVLKKAHNYILWLPDFKT